MGRFQGFGEVSTRSFVHAPPDVYAVGGDAPPGVSTSNVGLTAWAWQTACKMTADFAPPLPRWVENARGVLRNGAPLALRPHPLLVLLRQVHPPQQILQAGIVAQGLEGRDHEPRAKAVLVSCFQPSEGLIFFP